MKENKGLYLKLHDKLLADGVVKTVQIYSNQIARLVSNKNGTGVIGFPAALIEFTNINYIQKGNRHQEYTAILRLYTILYNMENVGFKIFDIMDAVHKSANLLITDYTTPLIRVRDDTDNDFTNVCVNITDYQFRGTIVPEPITTTVITGLDIKVKS